MNVREWPDLFEAKRRGAGIYDGWMNPGRGNDRGHEKEGGRLVNLHRI